MLMADCEQANINTPKRNGVRVRVRASDRETTERK